MCISALPPHLDSREEIDAAFPDDSQHSGFLGGLWRRWRKMIKPHTVFGPRDKHWYHRWRSRPITLIAFFGPGDSRWENNIMAIRSVNAPVFFYVPTGAHAFYLSRVQRWTAWHFQLAWPAFVCWHVTIKGKVWGGYFGAKADADNVVWCPALWFGKGYK